MIRHYIKETIKDSKGIFLTIYIVSVHGMAFEGVKWMLGLGNYPLSGMDEIYILLYTILGIVIVSAIVTLWFMLLLPIIRIILHPFWHKIVYPFVDWLKGLKQRNK